MSHLLQTRNLRTTKTKVGVYFVTLVSRPLSLEITKKLII